MAETTCKAAADRLAASVRGALRCIAQIEILHSGWELGVLNSLRVVSRNPHPGLALLRHSDRTPCFYLKVLLDYSVVLDATGHVRPRYRAEISRYIYAIQDLAGNELFSYHWHPGGSSDVWSPHLHVSAARDTLLSKQSGIPYNEILLGKLHFPTHHIELTELVRFLITELGVGPRRPDWERVLDRIEQISR